MGEARASGAGEMVLYWMHHGVRAEENPALDVARAAAAALDRPLLVYQGLGGRHPYDSDRHHAFILEGARDVAEALAAKGVRHVFHLPAGRTRSPLRELADRAALVVTEDFPAPPFPAWTRSLARRIAAPLWRVDTACVLPMALAARAFGRAFEFRRAHGEELRRRAALPWPDSAARPPAFDGDLGFVPVDLARTELAELWARSAIDHGIGPAPASRGGTRAGLARWSAFLEAGLADYHRLRNDAALAPPTGVSRISPYLHHGHLSPLRVAREASAHGGAGADKFLDELLIWRELAHNFCFHHEQLPGGPGCLDRLPEWARTSLERHDSDPRAVHYDWERLARGATGDDLWDAAQRSLLIHGELHNNLRMTWGKAFLGWTPGAERALELMLDLNHRYALDGSDPNSYGGLLYCLGLFDRPFSPERPVSGVLRTRSSEAHARRLDLPGFRARFNRRAAQGAPSVAVVGAGIAGLAAARTLQDQGFAVRVLERGRSVGGRAAHRRAEGRHFDHGAQYFTVVDARFGRYVSAWLEAGVVAPWQGRLAALAGDASVSEVTALARYVGVPGMNALAKHLAQDLDVTTECPINRLSREGGAWRLEAGSGAVLGPFDAVILAMPPEQARRLEPPGWLLEASRGLETQPCWCAMAAFATPLPLEFDGYFVNRGPLAWVARDSSKPGRPGGERWVIHAGSELSAARLDADPAAMADELLGQFFAVLGLERREPEYLAGHRWSFAQPQGQAPTECLWDAQTAIALCGDWCHGGRIEGAFLSGVAAAGRVASAGVGKSGFD